MPELLVEPNGEAVKETQLPANGIAADAQASAVEGKSAASSLLESLQTLKPAKADLTQAQKMSPAAEQKETPESKVETPDETDANKPAVSGSALESFQRDTRKARKEKNKAAAEAAAAPEADEVDDTPDEKKVAEAKEDETPVTEEEIQKTINDPGISKRHQKRMIHLAARAKELESKLAAAEAKPASVANDEAVKALAEREAAAQKELTQYRRRYSIESEPELKKFDEVATKAEESIYGKLKEAGLKDATLDIIKNAGGFDAFSRSTQTFTVNVRGEDGEVTPTQVTASQLARQWLNDMNVGDAEYIKAKLGERFNAVDAKKRRTEELVAGAEEWSKAQHQANLAASEQFAKAREAEQQEYSKWAGEFEKNQEWLKDKIAPANATPEEKADIEAYNNHNAGVRAVLKSASKLGSVKDYTSLVAEAATAIHFRRENARLQKELTAATDKVSRIQKGSTTTGKPSQSIQSQPKKKDDSAAAQLQTSAADSLHAAMEKMRSSGADE